MYKISPSAIGALLECPRCLWLFANENLKRPRGIYPSLPDGMDEVFKSYFDSYRQKGEVPPEIDGKVDGTLYTDLEKLSRWRDIDYGRGGFAAEFPEIQIVLRGAIDDLLVNDRGEYVPFDFKTRGMKNKEDTHKHYQHQLDLYSLLFRENGLKPASYGYLLFFWPKAYEAGQTTFEHQLVKMDISPDEGYKLLEKVYQIASSEEPASHEECEYCLYRSFLEKNNNS